MRNYRSSIICCPLIVSMLCLSNTTIASDFDNADIPRGKPFNLYAGCGTITKYQEVTDQAPRFSNRTPDQGNIGSGSDIAMIASVIPGIGSLIGAGIGLVTAAVANYAIDSNNKQKDVESAQKKSWRDVYLVTIKPDVGSEYTFVYENLNRKNMKEGARVIVLADAHAPNSFTGFQPYVPPVVPPMIGGENYFEICHGDGKYGLRVLEDTPNGFEWKMLPADIKPAGEAYLTRVAADRAKKEAERAEIDAMKLNESR